MTDRLPPPDALAPVKAAPASTALDNWLIAYQTGNSGEDGEDWCIVTDNVRASATLNLEMPGDAKDDAENIAAILNAYRTRRLSAAPTLAARVQELEAENERLREALFKCGGRDSVVDEIVAAALEEDRT